MAGFQYNQGKAVYGGGCCKGWPIAGAQGENDCPTGSVGASMVGLLGVGKGVLVGVADWGVMAGWDGGHYPLYFYCHSEVSRIEQYRHPVCRNVNAANHDRTA